MAAITQTKDSTMTYEERKRLLCQQCGKQQCGYANRDLQDKCTALQEWMQCWELGYQDATDNPTGGELLHVLNKGRKLGYKDATDRAVEFIYAKQLVVPNIEKLINELKKYMEEQQ